MALVVLPAIIVAFVLGGLLLGRILASNGQPNSLLVQVIFVTVGFAISIPIVIRMAKLA